MSERFHKKLAGLERRFKKDELKFELESSAEPAALESWVKQLSALDWNVYIEGPSSKESDSEQLAKYLARYMTGGPISDSRIISHEDGQGVPMVSQRKKRKKQTLYLLEKQTLYLLGCHHGDVDAK